MIQSGGIFYAVHSLRNNGPKEEQVKFINTRIIKPWDELPGYIAYATYTNFYRCAINEGIFSQLLQTTHSKNTEDRLPDHTIVIKASNLKLKVD